MNDRVYKGIKAGALTSAHLDCAVVADTQASAGFQTNTRKGQGMSWFSKTRLATRNCRERTAKLCGLCALGLSGNVSSVETAPFSIVATSRSGAGGILLFCLGMGTLISVPAQGVGFRYEGQVNYELLSDDGTSNIIKKNFVVEMDAASWAIQTAPVLLTEEDAIAYDAVVWMSNSLYSVAVRNPHYDFTAPKKRKLRLIEDGLTNPAVPKELGVKLLSEQRRLQKELQDLEASVPVFENDSVATVSYSVCPGFAQSLISPLWLAFASGEAVRQATNQVFPNWFDVLPAIEHYGKDARLTESEAFESSPRVLKRASFRRMTSEDPVVTYEVTSSTNVDGVILPLQSESVTWYHDDGFSSDAKARIHARVRVGVTDVVRNPKRSIIGKVEALTASVEDRRFQQDPNVGRSLFYKGSPIQPYRSIVLSSGYASAANAGIVPPSTKRGGIVRIIMIVLVLGPITVILLTKVRKQKG